MSHRHPRSRRILALERLEDRAVPATFLGLGDLPGGQYFSAAWGISGDGSAVVGNSDSRYVEAFRWTKPTGMVGLGDLPGVTRINTFAMDASWDGSFVVGGHGFLGNEAFRWKGGVMAGLGDLPGGAFYSFGMGVSADGSIVVGWSASGWSGEEAFLWIEGVGMVGLGGLPGGTWSRANGVSADGSVIVGHGGSTPGVQAFRWTKAGGMIGLGDLPGGTFNSAANGVSADGSVIVGVSSSTTGSEAFRWTKAGGMVGLDDLGAYPSSNAADVSADGSVIVGNAAFPTGSAAMIWNAKHGMRSLRDVLVNDFGLGPSLAGWTLWEATSISDDGLVIAGTGRNPAGQSEGWVANLRSSLSFSSAHDLPEIATSPALNGDAQAVGTILDDEPRISISDVAKVEGRKGQKTHFVFTATLSAAYDQPVTMSFNTVNGTAKTSNNDYVARTGTLTFAPGETSKTITVQVKGDSTRESNEYFYLDLSGNSSNALFTKSRGIETILNDD